MITSFMLTLTLQDHDKIALWGWYNWFRIATFAVIATCNTAAMVLSMP